MNKTLPPILAQLKELIKSKQYIITSPYGWRKHPLTGERQHHNGLDLAPVGEAPRWLVVGRPDAVIPLYHAACGLGLAAWYGGLYVGLCHLRAVALTEDRGWVVEVGATGMATGVHLHLVVAVGSRPRQVGSGTVVDPAGYLL